MTSTLMVCLKHIVWITAITLIGIICEYSFNTTRCHNITLFGTTSITIVLYQDHAVAEMLKDTAQLVCCKPITGSCTAAAVAEKAKRHNTTCVLQQAEHNSCALKTQHNLCANKWWCNASMPRLVARQRIAHWRLAQTNNRQRYLCYSC